MNTTDFNITHFIASILAEDIGHGDHTSLACIPTNAEGKARLLIKDDGIIAGIDLAKQIFHFIDPALQVDVKIPDGTAVQDGDIGLYVSGRKQTILKAERLVLNCMQRMSGIATQVNRYVKAIEGTNAKVLDTRKTTPGFRHIEKWAVRIGGGINHRMGLYDMMMIKDNHHDFCGGITPAIKAANTYIKRNNLAIKIELEVRNFDELEEALSVGNIHRIMFDNFSVADTYEAVKLVNNRFETESSGGITIETIRGYAETGVNYISVGALTHSYKSMDISLKAM